MEWQLQVTMPKEMPRLEQQSENRHRMAHQRLLLQHLPMCNQPRARKQNSLQTKADFLTFMVDCRECIANNKKEWLNRLEPSSIWPPNKPPDQSNIPTTMPLLFNFDVEYKLLYIYYTSVWYNLHTYSKSQDESLLVSLFALRQT